MHPFENLKELLSYLVTRTISVIVSCADTHCNVLRDASHGTITAPLIKLPPNNCLANTSKHVFGLASVGFPVTKVTANQISREEGALYSAIPVYPFAVDSISFKVPVYPPYWPFYRNCCSAAY